MYYIYMLRCSDNSLYTGITNNLDKRMKTHFTKKNNAAKYTKSRQAMSVEALWETETKSGALKLEARIKKLVKTKKELLVAHPELLLQFFEDLQDTYEYVVLQTQ